MKSDAGPLVWSNRDSLMFSCLRVDSYGCLPCLSGCFVLLCCTCDGNLCCFMYQYAFQHASINTSCWLQKDATGKQVTALSSAYSPYMWGTHQCTLWAKVALIFPGWVPEYEWHGIFLSTSSFIVVDQIWAKKFSGRFFKNIKTKCAKKEEAKRQDNLYIGKGLLTKSQEMISYI